MPRYTFGIELEITTFSTGAVSVEMYPLEGAEGDEKLVNDQADQIKQAVFAAIRNLDFKGQ